MDDFVYNSYIAFTNWKALKTKERACLLENLRSLLEKNRDYYALLMAEEMAKPLTQGRSEIEKCAWTCAYFAKEGINLLDDEVRESSLKKSFIRYEPLGPLLAIMPWNYPFWQVFRMAAPALIAGNSIILKHALNVPRCAQAIASLVSEAGAPEGLFISISANHEEIKEIIADQRIKAVTLTGSTRAGQAVAQLAGSFAKKVVLELGGSDPFIVLDDADVDKIIAPATEARCQNSGQSCIAAKRFIVHEDLFENFTNKLSTSFNNLVMGDPRNEQTQIGPLASKDQKNLVSSQVEDARNKGARIISRDQRLLEGNFYAPTIITNISSSMRVFSEEVFGPVACVYSYKTQEEALKQANNSNFGLSASVWTTNLPRALALAENIESGSVFINAIPRSDPRLPFGGIKNSGFGRELGREGLLEFVNIKTICVAQL